MEQLAIVLPFSKSFLWASYLMALLITLGKNHEQPYYVLHLCIMLIVFSHHFLISLPTSWRSTIANVPNTVCSVVRRAGSGTWHYSLRTVDKV